MANDDEDDTPGLGDTIDVSATEALEAVAVRSSNEGAGYLLQALAADIKEDRHALLREAADSFKLASETARDLARYTT
jgi:hypothetical protein